MFEVANLIWILLAGLLTAAAAWLLLYGILTLLVGRDARVRTRIRQFVTSEQRDAPSDTQERARQRAAMFAQMDTRWDSSSYFKRLRLDIDKADIRLTASEVLLGQVVAALACAVAFAVLFPAMALLMGVVGLLVGPMFVRSYLRFLGKRRIRRFENQLPDTLAILASSVRGGFSLFQGLQLISREAAEPVKTEFLRVVQEISLGNPMDTALEGLTKRVPTEDIDILVTAITLQQQTGGNLSHVLEVVAHTVRERHRVQREISSMTAQQRFSANLLALIPFLLGGVLFIISPTYISHMFKPGWVLCMPIGVVVFSIIGYATMRKMASIDV